MDRWEVDDDAALKALIERVRPDTTPPRGSRERLECRLREAIRQREQQQVRLVARRASVRRWVGRGVSAAALITLVTIASLLLVSGSATAGFAEMVRQVQKADTVVHRLTITATGRAPESAEILITREGSFRVKWNSGKTQVHNHAEGRSLLLSARSGKARLRDSDSPAPSGLLLDLLATATEADAELLGLVELDGRRVEAYRLRKAAAGLLVWADPETHLPVKMEAESPGSNGPTVLVLDRFRWNASVPEGAFDLSIPEGFALVKPVEPTQEALIDSLRMCAERSDGVFPASFEMLTVSRLFMEGFPAVPLDPGVDEHIAIGVSVEPDEESKQFFRTSRTALAFVERIGANGTWKYVGGGVALGDGTKPVCWWRADNSKNFRVVYGDLEVRDVPPEQLPESP
jgi:outer membrane lipoprotein-sorting protein